MLGRREAGAETGFLIISYGDFDHEAAIAASCKKWWQVVYPFPSKTYSKKSGSGLIAPAEQPGLSVQGSAGPGLADRRFSSSSPWAKSEKVTIWSHEREQRFDTSNPFFNL